VGSHNVLQLFAYGKVTEEVHFYLLSINLFFNFIFVLFLFSFITAKLKMSTHQEKAQCVWRVSLRVNKTVRDFWGEISKKCYDSIRYLLL
jgi:hypothetical protein